METLNEIKSALISCIATCKGGIPLDDLNDEFHTLTGRDIPYLKLGFSCLYEFISNVENISTKRNEFGQVVYYIKGNDKIQHLIDLIDRQKDVRPKRLQRTKSKRLRKVKEPKKSPISVGRAKKNGNGSLPDDEVVTNEYRSPVFVSQPPENTVDVHEPLMAGQQLIGDDFFLQLAIRNLGNSIWRPENSMALRCGLCVSGQTIRACTKALSSVRSINNRVIIMLGVQDIYEGRSFEDMTDDFHKLLDVLSEKFFISDRAITLCTLPPLANLGVYTHSDQWIVYHKFNSFLRVMVFKRPYRLVDLSNNMTTPNIEIEWDYFQIDARMVSGTRHPYVLWNRKGRKFAMNLLNGNTANVTPYYN